MKRGTWGLLVISVVCIASIIAAAVTYHQKLRFQTLTESSGLASATTALVNAETELNSNHLNRAGQDIERASGSLMATSYPMLALGYHNVSSIAVRFELIGEDVQKGTITHRERQYLNQSVKALSSLFDTNGRLMKIKVSSVMNQMYQTMPK